MVSADVCKPNTQIPVEELLEALKMFKREEIEAEQTDDESVDRHGAGLLREYQVWFSFAFPHGSTAHLLPLPWMCNAVGLGQLQNTSQCRVGLFSSSTAIVLHFVAPLQCWEGAM